MHSGSSKTRFTVNCYALHVLHCPRDMLIVVRVCYYLSDIGHGFDI